MVRRVAILAYEGCQSLDVTGPLEVFHAACVRRAADAATHGEAAPYEARVVGFTAERVRTESGLWLCPDEPLDALSPTHAAQLHTLIVPGGPGLEKLLGDSAAMARLTRVAGSAQRVASVCTGAFLLARIGLLTGRRATTHWAYCDELSYHFPDVQLQRDTLYVEDRGVWSSAGVTAGIDLTLALVERDLGAKLASEIARWLVVFVRRSGGQAQVSAALSAQSAELASVRELAAWVADHPTCDLSIPQLAKRCGMSARNFARAFREQLGATPRRFIEQARIDVAKRLLEASERSVDEVAEEAGFASAHSLRRALRRSVGAGPREYRTRARPRAVERR